MKRKRSDNERRGLRAGISTRAHDEGNEEGEHNRLLDLRLVVLHGACCRSISERNRTHSQPARFLTIEVKLIFRYGSSNASVPPNF